MELYVKAGAKYFVALANHHDNFDNYDSTHHEWNSVHIGPKKDIVGTWAKLARAQRAALRRDQPFRRIRGTGFRRRMATIPKARWPACLTMAYLTAAQGKGKWWDGLDPQQLYNGAIMPMPKGITTHQRRQRLSQGRTTPNGTKRRRRIIRNLSSAGSCGARS